MLLFRRLSDVRLILLLSLPINFVLWGTEVGEYHKNDGDRFRFQAYMKAIKAIRDYPAPITSGKEALKLVRDYETVYGE